MADLPLHLLEFSRRHELFAPGEHVLVALSGGPDSVALALVLSELAATGQLEVQVSLAHLNHGLRDKESDAEEEFCRRFAQEKGLAIIVERADVRQAASRGGTSLEAAGREARYRFLLHAARDVRAAAVATAHHADDVAETVLMRLLRGAALHGLGAMAPARPLAPDVRLVRPLLETRRSELTAYLQSRGQRYCTDSSNDDPRFTRNRIRRRLLPYLEQEFPTFSVEGLCALNEAALEVADFLARRAGELCRRAQLREGVGEVVLDAEVLARAHRAVVKAALALAAERVCRSDEPLALGATHYRMLAELPTAPVGTEVTLPQQILARRDHGVVHLSCRRTPPGIPERGLPLPGSVDVPEAGLRIACVELTPGAVTPENVAAQSSGSTVYVDRASVREPLVVRGRRRGDVFHPLGAPGRARLKEFLINAKVPRGERDRIPLVVDASGDVVWVVGHRIADPVRLRSAQARALRLAATALDEAVS